MSVFEPPIQFRSLTPIDDFMQKAKYFTEFSINSQTKQSYAIKYFLSNIIPLHTAKTARGNNKPALQIRTGIKYVLALLSFSRRR